MLSHPTYSRRITPLLIALVLTLVLAGAACEAINLPLAPTGSTSPQAARTLAAGLTAAAKASTTPTQQPASPPTRQATSAATPGGGFDYFVLALSWSPDYCADNGSNDPQQCSVGRKLGFVLHGLWPQYNQGYPSDCSTAPLPKALKADFAGLYPNDNLFAHEWSKHGTCSGLEARAYLELSRSLMQSVAIPKTYQSPSQPFRSNLWELKQAFEQSNTGFVEASFEVFCSGSGRYLKELYVCFGKDGQPAACGKDVHKDALKSCAGPDFLVRNIR